MGGKETEGAIDGVHEGGIRLGLDNMWDHLEEIDGQNK